MKNFIEDCINGLALISDIDDYIQKWHEKESNVDLRTFLGMDKNEYEDFVRDENYLQFILNQRIENK